MKKSISALMVAAAMAVSVSAQAGMITDSFVNDFELTEINQSGTLAMFDGALGTLDSITLTLSGRSLSDTTLTNNASASEDFEFQSILNFFYDLSSLGLTAPRPAFTTILATTGGEISLGTGQTEILGPNSDQSSYNVEIFAVDFASFIGTAGDSFSIDCNTRTDSLFFGGGGNISNVQHTTAACFADITYNFTETTIPPTTDVPEPASLFLFGAGLLGLAGMRKRKAS